MLDTEKLTERCVAGCSYAPPSPPEPAQCSRTNPGTKATSFTGEILRNLTIGVPPNEPMEGVWICCQIAGEEGAREGYAGWTFKPRKCQTGKVSNGD